MNNNKYLSELRPELKLIVDQLPPMGTKIWMVSEHGCGFSGDYHPGFGVVAWCGLPKLTPEQKKRLRGMKESGINPTIHPSRIYENLFEGLPCIVSF